MLASQRQTLTKPAVAKYRGLFLANGSYQSLATLAPETKLKLATVTLISMYSESFSLQLRSWRLGVFLNVSTSYNMYHHCRHYGRLNAATATPCACSLTLYVC